jgi:nucleotide-binding universal stress UspA family protein
MSMHPPARVIVGVDGSVVAAEAARAATLEASRRGLPLRLVRAFHWPHGALDGLPDELDACAVARRAANADLERLRGLLTSQLPRGAITAALIDGRPELVLRAASAEADLLVLGATGLTWGHGPGPVVGSVTEAVATSASCPVLVHRTPPAGTTRRTGVLAGIDGGPGTDDVLAAAAAEARLRGEPLHVVHAWRQFTEDAFEPLRWRVDTEAGDRAERAAVDEHLARLARTAPGLAVTSEVVAGRPGHVLLEGATHAVLLVAGVRPPGTPGQGATAHALLHRCPTPVLLVPVPAREGGHALSASRQRTLAWSSVG